MKPTEVDAIKKKVNRRCGNGDLRVAMERYGIKDAQISSVMRQALSHRAPICKATASGEVRSALEYAG